MRLLFKQKMFSWFDSYDVFYENGQAAFKVKGELSWGHCLKIYDPQGNYLGMVKEKVISFRPTFNIFIGNNQVGSIRKEITFLKPKFQLDFNGWTVSGDFFEWDYSVYSGRNLVMNVSKQVWNFTDTYIIDVQDPHNALAGVLITLAIDAEKCSRNNH